MSMNAIALIDNGFYFDGVRVSPSALGRDIVRTLLQGKEYTDSGWKKSSVTVNYVLGMLRHAARAGDFFDVLDDTCDHAFDPNVPTPGTSWGELQDLRAQARAAEFESRDIRDSESLRFLSPSFAALAQELRDAANELDTTTYGMRPLRDGITVPSAKCWNRRIGTNAIWWDGQVFKFGGYSVSPTVVGRMIAATLLRGEEWVLVGEQSVTVNYLVQMCREVGRHGEFVDYTDEADFDPNVAPDMSPDA